MSKLAYTTANLSDIQLKEQGNQLFVLRKFDEAVGCYTKAIIKNPNNATFFTNRALCYLKLKRWQLACQDCRRALDIDSNLLKAHFFLGQCLIGMELYDEAIKHLQRAFDLSKEQKQNFGDDITSQLRLARKKRWSLLEEKRICHEIELQSYLNKLMKEDMDRLLEGLKLDDNVTDHELREKQQEIEQQCVSITCS
ncbi:PREDICTED: E3 ubiquitin-protein ligase CHIP-like [Rhagoletis zephyria]|uniref:E3 ubiquitin-protein ligase CHIP-like n=1 Tax=Rhagoletis zephyria TaxID=28612 RepID=UPI00081128F9|nr:PREDICTED: E3 ubiquitin-protein ligase CHIP-like [Rhagoletis zephyria]